MLGSAGLDVHKDSVQACAVNNEGVGLLQKRFTTTDAGLEALYNSVKDYDCVMEASTACFRVYDYLKDRGVKVKVCHPKRVKAICSAKIKTDKVDAETLAQLNRADFIPLAYIPSKEIRQQQDIIREHVQLTKQKTRIINQTKAFLLRNRIKTDYLPLTNKGIKLIETSTLPFNIKIKLTNAKQQFDLIKKQLKQINNTINELAKQNPDAKLLETIPGVGTLSAMIITLQIDGIQRFETLDQLISYAGLCPNIHQSANTISQTKITHDNCHLLRWILIQDAWQAARYGARFKKIFNKKAKKKGKHKAIIIVAKKLLTIMYFMLRNKTPYNPKTGGRS